MFLTVYNFRMLITTTIPFAGGGGGPVVSPGGVKMRNGAHVQQREKQVGVKR